MATPTKADVFKFLDENVILHRRGVTSDDLMIRTYLIYGGLQQLIRFYFPNFRTQMEQTEIAREWLKQTPFFKRKKTTK
jgi:hypothetical protein